MTRQADINILNCEIANISGFDSWKTNTVRDPYRMHAQFCRSIASAKRLHILDKLRDGPMSVSQLAEAIGVSPSNVSQHIAILRQHGIVAGERQGTTIIYQLTHPELMEAYDLIHEVMRRVQQKRVDDLAEGDGES